MKLNDLTCNSQVSSIVLANKEVLFGNIVEIYQFHSKLVIFFFFYFESFFINV
jgi:hypothetical protein